MVYVPALPANLETLKQRGNELFKSGQYGEAASCYTKALKSMQGMFYCHLEIFTLCTLLILNGVEWLVSSPRQDNDTENILVSTTIMIVFFPSHILYLERKLLVILI